MPSLPFVVPSLLLAAILGFSGVAKLRYPADAASVFDKLQLPRFLTTIKAPTLLPYGELALAVLLVVTPGVWYLVMTTASLVLFAVYVAVVAHALRLPYPLMCGCFGRLGLGWITRQTLVRNLVLLAVALVAWLDAFRREGVVQRVPDLGEQAWWLAGVVLAVVASALVVKPSDMPQPSPLPIDDEGEYLARPVPYTVVDGPAGPGSLWALSDVAARFLVFGDPTDAQLQARVASWAEDLQPVQVHLVARSEWSVISTHAPEVAATSLGDPDGETGRRLGVFEWPGGVLLGTDRYTAAGPVTGLEAIDELVEAVAEELRTSGQVAADAGSPPS